MKDYFFPDLTKEEVFAQGFVATKSGHSRGSTLDMTLVYKKNGTEPRPSVHRAADYQLHRIPVRCHLCRD